MFDVVVVGGGPAGLSAALMLGRCRRGVLLCGLGQPRNRRSQALHGYLTRDGIAPSAFTDLGRADRFFTARTGQHPQSDLAVKLGCTSTQRGTVQTGTLCDTNVPRLFVAGDASRDAQFVIVAAAEGVKAAVAINKALKAEELKP